MMSYYKANNFEPNVMVAFKGDVEAELASKNLEIKELMKQVSDLEKEIECEFGVPKKTTLDKHKPKDLR